MRSIDADLLVVGAGPAGCAAAVAARAEARSLRVVVIDAARFPRDKLCGGAIPGGGRRELALAGLSLRVPHAVAAQVRLRVAGADLRVPLPIPAVVVERRAFDADLVAQARSSGAEVLEGAALLGVEGRVAATAAGPVAFRALVAADGASAAGRRALGLPPGPRLPLREARVPRGQEDLLFDLDAGAGGYAWRFPCPGGAGPEENAGAYAFRGGGACADAALRELARAEGLCLNGDAWSLRPRGRGEPVGVPGALLAGEALGVDPLAGEGIRYALWSGRIAGRSAARALRAGRLPSPAAYARALARTRTGAVLALFVRLAPRLYGEDPRWRRLAADAAVAAGFADLVSGAAVLPAAARLLARWASLAAARQVRSAPGEPGGNLAGTGRPA